MNLGKSHFNALFFCGNSFAHVSAEYFFLLFFMLVVSRMFCSYRGGLPRAFNTQMSGIGSAHQSASEQFDQLFGHAVRAGLVIGGDGQYFMCL